MSPTFGIVTSIGTAPAFFMASAASAISFRTPGLLPTRFWTIPIRAPSSPFGSSADDSPPLQLTRAPRVDASRGSSPTMTSSSAAASATVRAIGPAVSWLCAIGTIPDRLTSPKVGLMPTIPHADAGATTDPSVSVPTATAQRLAETATPDPLLDPLGFRSSAYGFLHCPPRPLHPLVERVDRKFAHSL